MATRYAIIVTNDEGQKQVSDIKQMEGAAPDVPRGYEVVEVPDGVLIGMIKGGKKDAVGGFGFPDGSEGAAERSNALTGDAPKPKAAALMPATKGKAAKTAAKAEDKPAADETKTDAAE
jgi:hypothetical protein